MGQEEITRKIIKHFEINKNKNTAYQNLGLQLKQGWELYSYKCV